MARVRHEFKDGTRLAFDENIADREMGSYARDGNIIVCVAKHAEADEDWVDRAFQRDADVCISNDSDVGNYIQKMDYPMRWKLP